MFLRLRHKIPGMRIGVYGGARMGYLFGFLRGEELRSLNCAFSFEQRIRDPHLTRWPELEFAGVRRRG